MARSNKKKIADAVNRILNGPAVAPAPALPAIEEPRHTTWTFRTFPDQQTVNADTFRVADAVGIAGTGLRYEYQRRDQWNADLRRLGEYRRRHEQANQDYCRELGQQFIYACRGDEPMAGFDGFLRMGADPVREVTPMKFALIKGDGTIDEPT